MFYVYAYLDPRKPGNFSYNGENFDFEPFYIGMGKGKRYQAHLKTDSLNSNCNPIKNGKIKHILDLGQKPIIIKLKENLSKQEAQLWEIHFIKVIGRYNLNLGPLSNLTNGGESTAGMIHSESTKQLLSQQRKGKPKTEAQMAAPQHQKGRTISEETKKKISNSLKGRKLLSDEQYKEIAEKRKGYKHSEETKKRWSLKRKGLPKTEAQIKAQEALSQRYMENIMPLDEFKEYFKSTNSKTSREWLTYFRNNETPTGVYSNPVEAYKKRGIQITWKELLGKN
ncbi:MAG: NUMOD3 domain-containing DNA-binding protein [Gammaproteobacteria bacterium]|nr:NUMOD3 domain-containing DNA-binding protein [Gammaproteobacteria bacterium]